ncbi:MAG: DUF1573 domain-containing protein [Candidatus Aminicenantes bacterium]|nr:DUF1573 domain-containing protein [Candidatus Aminicenantes bacterium]
MRRANESWALKFWLLITLVVILSNFILALSTEQPRITFKEKVKSFTKVKEGAKLRHEFIFTNTGNAPLMIKRVTTSCGCTAALVSEDKIMPGKEGKISVEFDTRGYYGQVTKLVYVESNDPIEPRQVLEIQAEIEVPPSPKIELNVYNYEAGLILAGENLEVKIKVSNKGELDLQAEFNHRQAQFQVGQKTLTGAIKIGPGKTQEVIIKLPTENRSGLLREYVLIRSNDPLRSTISLFISGYIVTLEQLNELVRKYRHLIDKK